MSLLSFEDILYKLVAIVVIIGVYKLVKRLIQRVGLRLPPGPGGLPLIGHVGEFTGPSLLHHKDTYGDVSYVHVFSTDIVILNTLEAIREAYTRSDNAFANRPKLFITDYILPEDVAFRSPADTHLKKLRMIMHSTIKAYGRGILETERVISDELDYVEMKLMDRIGTEIDLMDILVPSVANILCILLIHERYDYDHDMHQQLLQYDTSMNYIGEPMIGMVLKLIPFLRFLPFWVGSQVQKAIASQNAILARLYEPYRDLSSSELNERNGAAFRFIAEQRQNSDILSEEHVRGAILDVMAGGSNTTIPSLYHFFLILIHYPDVKNKIHAEIDDFIGHDRQPCLADKTHMPYTKAAILELMRFSSVLPFSVPHSSTRREKFREFVLPPDTLIMANLFKVHHDPDLWENPWKFEPVRFLDDEGSLLSATHPVRKNLLPFGIGTRACIGEVFAKTRMFLYVTRILQKFDLVSRDPLSCDPRDMQPGFAAYQKKYLISFVERI